MAGRIKKHIAEIEQTIADGPWSPALTSLEKAPVPDWYRNGKFGIFIHWGLYSVPAFGNEWYPREMYQQGSPAFEHHLKTYGPHNRFGYKDFIPSFTGSRFNAAEWAGLFREAGARFVVPVAEHHDGFALYASELNRWNAAAMGPKRDIIGELEQAVRAEGIVYGLSSHRAEHYWFFKGGTGFDSDVNNPEFADLYGPFVDGPDLKQEDLHRFHAAPMPQELVDDWLVRTCEFVDRYRPQLVWFDWWINNMAYRPAVLKFAAWYYNRAAAWNLPVSINYKYDVLTPQSAVFDIERGQTDDIFPCFWQNDTSVSKSSWGYTVPQDWKTAASLIADLVDVVSKNGALLLNIGPKPDGTIPDEEVELLREIGRWLTVNGEAVYDTRPWTVYGEGPTKLASGAFTDTAHPAYTPADIRFTCTDRALYAIPLARPADGIIRIYQLAKGSNHSPPNIHSLELLGHGPVEWTHDEYSLTVKLPNPGKSAVPCVIKIGR